MKVERIDHICIAVKDLKKAEEYYSDLFEREPVLRYQFEPEEIDVVRYQIGEVFFEILTGMSERSEVSKFIERKGEGVFLLSFKVPNTKEALAECHEKGISMIDKVPRHWRGSDYAFANPKGFHGVLVEIID
jgi:methylmalonyl-CoA/ethylmalonyl-CoA epimerase